MDKVYRFYAYNNLWWPDKYLWHQEECDAYLMMSAANFIDTLLDELGPSVFDINKERPLIKTETLHIDMDRLMRTNPELTRKTIRMVQDFDDTSMSPIAIKDWLKELEYWVCAKILSDKEQ